MLRAPRKLSEPILSLSWTTRLIAISFLIALGSIIAAHLGSKTSQQLSQTMAFTQLVVLELAILFFLRLPLSPFSNKGLLVATGGSFSLQLAVLYFSPIHPLFGTTFLMLQDWLHILGITFAVCLASFFIIRKETAK
jgi:Ca2+-transporting ATPase